MWRGQKSKVRTRPTNSNAPSFSSNGPCLVYGQCAATSLWSGLGARCLRVGYLTLREEQIKSVLWPRSKVP
jgi:hypothetical protein